MTSPTIAPKTMQRVFSSHSTATAFIQTTAANAVVIAKDFADTAAQKRIPIGKSLAATIMFYGTGDADDVFDARVYAEYDLSDVNGVKTGEVMRQLLGVATCTLGAETGATSGLAIAATDKIVDTIVWTINAFLTAAETAFDEGNSAAHSPANDEIGVLFLPCLARATSLVFEFDATTGAPTGMNASVMLAPA